MINNKRENNYDLLRIICAISVIAIHVSATFVQAIQEQIMDNNVEVICLYNMLTRFAVPCFIMLSGAFILADNSNMDYKYFYKKVLKNTGVPTLIFTIIYFLISMTSKMSSVIMGIHDISYLKEPIKQVLVGRPYYHMWYLYMLIFIYLLVPIVIRFKNNIGEEKFRKVAIIFFILSCISEWTSTHLLEWDLGSSFCYLGYFMLGYVIRRNTKNIEKKSNLKGIVLIITGILSELIITYIRFEQLTLNVSSKYALEVPCNPFVMFASVFIFLGFSKITIKTELRKIAAITLYIYLFHAVVWQILEKIIKSIGVFNLKIGIIIPLCIIIVYTISMIFSKIYIFIWNYLERRMNITNKLYKLMHLD